jgi:hypothetical protein
MLVVAPATTGWAQLAATGTEATVTWSGTLVLSVVVAPARPAHACASRRRRDRGPAGAPRHGDDCHPALSARHADQLPKAAVGWPTAEAHLGVPSTPPSRNRVATAVQVVSSMSC